MKKFITTEVTYKILQVKVFKRCVLYDKQASNNLLIQISHIKNNSFARTKTNSKIIQKEKENEIPNQ